MAVYDLHEIKHLRKKNGLSQSELAKLANVSQSLIAKIEAKRIDPTFSKAMKIFDTLHNLNNKKELKAEQLMNKKIVSLKPTDVIKDAVKKMKQYDISQMPVIKGDNVVGIVSEGILLDALMDNKANEDIAHIMKDAPPIVAKDANAGVVSQLLRHYPVVIVSAKGKVAGLITKADVLERMVK
tara:strand:- start:852 stop:1400 length:549 start_codon:yes stop_codon:yes gene_type:complete